VKPTKQEKAKAMWLKGDQTVEAIAEKLGVTSRTVHNWKRKGGWEALKESVEPDTPEPARRPKLVSFDRESRQQRRSEVDFTRVDYGSIEGRLQAIDELLDATRREVMNPTSPQQYSAAVGGFNKLLESRDRVSPLDRMQMLLKLQDMFRDPVELLEYLKATGWGRKAS
jgi:transposase-like protein